MKLDWKDRPEDAIQVSISYATDYVISHWKPDLHILTYRPTGHHVYIGTYKTCEAAKAGAEHHLKTL